MAAQPKHGEETTEAAPPPPYKPSTPNDPSGQKPTPATGGKWYREDSQTTTIGSTFLSEPSMDWSSQKWVAKMQVKCSDVPRLMREGFHWSSSNVINEDGFTDKNFTILEYPLNKREWGHNRHYFLKDLHEPPRWIATIEVIALRLKTLSLFDLRQLSPEKNSYTKALTDDRKQIYQYHYSNPDDCFNVIYNDTPLGGQWPWPKEHNKDKKGRR